MIVAGMEVTNRLPPKQGDLIGRSIAGYVIDGLIGEGGMGAVYTAYNQTLDKRAAVKVMLAEYTQDRDLTARFFREAKAVAMVCDPNIIEIYAADRFPEDGRLYILMPFIEGGSLEALCRRIGPLPLDVAAAVILQVASGLDAIHELAIVHRDIKCENILITSRHRRTYFPIIVDFGIAKLRDPHLATRTGVTLGSPGSMAPEQARGAGGVDARADIYSLGAVMYRMLCGRMPYQETDLEALIEKQMRGEPYPRPRELRRDLPASWEHAIMAALAFDPSQRPRSVREMADRIAEGLPDGETVLRELAPRLRADARGPTERLTRRPVVPIALAMIAGVAIGGAAMKLLGTEPAVSQTGTLVVTVKPSAEVYIDDISFGRTPLRQTIATGTHKLRLVKGDRQEELSVTIDPTKATTITRSWDSVR